MRAAKHILWLFQFLIFLAWHFRHLYRRFSCFLKKGEILLGWFPFQDDSKEKASWRAITGISDLISRIHYFLELITNLKGWWKMNQRMYVIKCSCKFQNEKQFQQYPAKFSIFWEFMCKIFPLPSRLEKCPQNSFPREMIYFIRDLRGHKCPTLTCEWEAQ